MFIENSIIKFSADINMKFYTAILDGFYFLTVIEKTILKHETTFIQRSN